MNSNEVKKMYAWLSKTIYNLHKEEYDTMVLLTLSIYLFSILIKANSVSKEEALRIIDRLLTRSMPDSKFKPHIGNQIFEDNKESMTAIVQMVWERSYSSDLIYLKEWEMICNKGLDTTKIKTISKAIIENLEISDYQFSLVLYLIRASLRVNGQ